jgi:hypothetical protein
MPIEDTVRLPALQYVDAHLIDEATVRDGFKFITNPPLLELIMLELRSARYIFRLMEMLDLKDTFSHPFCKFQIVQYAGVVEASIDHLLFERKYQNTKLESKIKEARSRLETHVTPTRVSGLSSRTTVSFDGKEAFLAVMRESKKPRVNISFENRLQECLDLSFVDEKLLKELNAFYKQRHSVHLAANLRDKITIEVADAKRAFRRINALCENVKRGFAKHQEPW